METNLDRLRKAWYLFVTTAREICEKDPDLLSVDLWREMATFACNAEQVTVATRELQQAKSRYELQPHPRP